MSTPRRAATKGLWTGPMSKTAEPGAAKPDWAQEAERQVLDHAITLAPRDGWTWRTAKRAGAAAGLSEGETELLLPNGPADLAALLSRRHDARALVILGATDP